MQLSRSISSIQFSLETIGRLRLSQFYFLQHSSQGVTVQKVARVVLGGFAMLSLYDLISDFLPFKGKVIVHGTLVFVVTCLVLSQLLKRFQKDSIHPHSRLSPESPLSNFRGHPLDESPFSNVRRGLLPAFEAADE